MSGISARIICRCHFLKSLRSWPVRRRAEYKISSAWCGHPVPGRRSKSLPGVLEKLAMPGFSDEILYLDAGDQALLKRFRGDAAQPSAGEGRPPGGWASEESVRRYRFLKEQSDYIIDTSALLTRELRSEMGKKFLWDSREFRNIFVTVLCLWI